LARRFFPEKTCNELEEIRRQTYKLAHLKAAADRGDEKAIAALYENLGKVADDTLKHLPRRFRPW